MYSVGVVLFDKWLRAWQQSITTITLHVKNQVRCILFKNLPLHYELSPLSWKSQ